MCTAVYDMPMCEGRVVRRHGGPGSAAAWGASGSVHTAVLPMGYGGARSVAMGRR